VHPFFKQRGIKDGVLLDILTCMEFLECEKEKVVFEIGSQGDLFYLILDGVIEITIPDPNSTQAFNEINKKILLIQS
jgi:hypothetical protein